MKILFDENGKKLNIDLSKDQVNTYLGVIETKKIKKAKHGDVITTSAGKKIIVLEADFVDKFENIKRGPQIITLKDAAFIAAYTGISSGTKVVEAGSGSGALTSYLANIVKPEGKVYSYEKREDFLKIAKENVKMFGLSKYVKFKNKSTHDGIREKNVDVVILDMPDPWNSLKHAEKALKVGGFLVCYLPNISQVEELLDAAKETSFNTMKIAKVILKESTSEMKFRVKIKRNSYLVFLRKLPF